MQTQSRSPTGQQQGIAAITSESDVSRPARLHDVGRLAPIMPAGAAVGAGASPIWLVVVCWKPLPSSRPEETRQCLAIRVQDQSIFAARGHHCENKITSHKSTDR